jgi:MYXO-CTERM domain-containing protein
VQLFAPLLKKGASQGFSVDPILADKLLLAPGDTLIVVVRFEPPEEPPADNAAPVGEVQLETTRGTLKKVEVGLVNNCACSSSRSHGSPAAGLGFVAALGALLVVRRRRRR